VGLSHGRDLRLFLMEGIVRRQIPRHYGVSVLQSLSRLLEAEKARYGHLLKSYRLYVGKNQTALLGATTLIKVNGPTCFPQFF